MEFVQNPLNGILRKTFWVDHNWHMLDDSSWFSGCFSQQGNDESLWILFSDSLVIHLMATGTFWLLTERPPLQPKDAVLHHSCALSLWVLEFHSLSHSSFARTLNYFSIRVLVWWTWDGFWTSSPGSCFLFPGFIYFILYCWAGRWFQIYSAFPISWK